MTAVPKNIRALTDLRAFEIQWDDATVRQIGFMALRGLCPCASCVNEFTGERMIDVNSISEEIQPTRLDYAGSYALKIAWSDGHDTGLFTWERLREIGEAIDSKSRKTQAGDTEE